MSMVTDYLEEAAVLAAACKRDKVQLSVQVAGILIEGHRRDDDMFYALVVPWAELEYADANPLTRPVQSVLSVLSGERVTL